MEELDESSSRASCAQCPPNTFSSGTGSTSCTDCAIGMWSEAGADECMSCKSQTWDYNNDATSLYVSLLTPEQVAAKNAGEAANATLACSNGLVVKDGVILPDSVCKPYTGSADTVVYGRDAEYVTFRATYTDPVAGSVDSTDLQGIVVQINGLNPNPYFPCGVIVTESGNKLADYYR